jgi:hypothetical protein
MLGLCRETLTKPRETLRNLRGFRDVSRRFRKGFAAGIERRGNPYI